MSKSVRDKIDSLLKTDADINAFCIDVFPDIYKRFSHGMQRLEKVNLLFEVIGAISVEKKLLIWVENQPSFNQIIESKYPVRPRFIVVLLAAVALLTTVSICLLLFFLLPNRKPKIIFVPQSSIEAQLSSLGIKEDQFDSPESFIEKVQKSGEHKIHYEVSIKSDQETKELIRLILALLTKDDTFVAVTKYRKSQSEALRNLKKSKSNLWPVLIKTIEASDREALLPDLALVIPADMMHTLLTADLEAHSIRSIQEMTAQQHLPLVHDQIQSSKKQIINRFPRNSGYIISRLHGISGKNSIEQEYVINKCAKALLGRQGDGILIQCRDGNMSVSYQSFYGEDVDRFKHCLSRNPISKCGTDELRVHWR